MPLIDEIIERMVHALGVKNAAEMSRKMGFSSGLVSTWRKRDLVPDGPLAKVSEISGAPIGWLRTGDGPAPGWYAGWANPDLSSEVREAFAGFQKFNRELMIEIIEFIEDTQKELKAEMISHKKAELIVLIYEESIKEGGINPEKVGKLIKLAM